MKIEKGTFKISSKDYAILRELDSKSRHPYSKIARKLRLSEETLRYRVRHLEKNQVIQAYRTLIDGGKLGFYYYKVLLKLHNIESEKVEKLVKFLRAKGRVNWVVRLDGVFDLGFTVKLSNPIRVSKLIDELRRKFHGCIRKWVYSVNMRLDYLGRDYLTGTKRKVKTSGSYTAYTKEFRKDETDLTILYTLMDNSRISNVELGKKVGLSSEGVAGRIRRLEKAGIISKYHIDIDHQKLGLLNFYVLIELQCLTLEQERKFVESCFLIPQAVYVIKALGEWDYELSLEVNSVSEYRDVMMKLRREYVDELLDYQGMIVDRMYR